jgi:type I restriction enzyme S subunit
MIIQTDLRQFPCNNSSLRFSYRWNKAGRIQEKLLTTSDDFVRLGKYIIKTRNGYSPECKESDSKTLVLGIDSISKNTNLSFDNPKYSDAAIPNKQEYTVCDGDFFVSRGNTTDLVALASVAHICEETEPVIFPDLMIRIDFTSDVNKRYMAYIFNSFVGRLYFKYATKGKNQTMVKASAKELCDFYVPLPSLDEQQRIVNEIQAKMNKQNDVKSQIADLREKIDAIIERVLIE